LLAALGLVPLLWVGLTSGDWTVARIALVDPIVVAGVCIAIGALAFERIQPAISRAAGALVRIPDRRFIAVVGLSIVLTGALVATMAYAGQPALTDELSQAFQGRILMSGRLSATPETYREFFEIPQTVNRFGRWFSEYPVGSGALAAVAGWTGLGILINPLLLAVAAVATWAFARRAYDEATARLAMILVAVSPYAVFMSATRMNSVPALALTAVALAALARWAESTSWRSRFLPAAGLGTAIGALVLFRPYDAALIALPVGVFQLAMIRRRRELAPSLAVQITAAIAICSIQLWVNARTTGSPFLFGYDALNGAAHRPGFHVDPLGFPFTPGRGLDHVMLDLQRLNTTLFESSVPALVFILAAMWLAEPTPWDWLLAGVTLSLLAGYGMYWYQGQLNEPRFLFPAVVCLVVFAARFSVLLFRRRAPIPTGVALILPVCVGLAFLPSSIGNRSTGIWLRLSQMRNAPVSRSENPPAEAEVVRLSNALVFVREPLHARLTARLRAIGMAPFDAERSVADLDACALLTALAASDARPDVPDATRLGQVFEQARAAGPATPVRGLYGNNALSLVGGRASNAGCYREMVEDSVGTTYYARFLAASTIDSTGRLGGGVVYARWLGARDSILLKERFATRKWYIYRRDERLNSGRFERIR
jgi:hypothetical protein